MKASSATENLQRGGKPLSWMQVNSVGDWGCHNSQVMVQQISFTATVPCGGFAGLSGSSLPVNFLATVCLSSFGYEKLDPEMVQGPLWGSGTAQGPTSIQCWGAGGSPGCLGCCFAAPGFHLCPWIFSEDFLAAPAAWDMLVSEISCLFTPPTARVAVCRGTGQIWDGFEVVQLLGSNSDGNGTAEVKEKFPLAVSRLGTAPPLCSEPGTRWCSPWGPAGALGLCSPGTGAARGPRPI